MQNLTGCLEAAWCVAPWCWSAEIPGIGKSTPLLQVCRNLAGQEQKVLYVSGEESLKQIKLRASRIGTVRGPLSFLSETNLDTIAEVIREVRPDVVVIDSIQTMFIEAAGSAPGSVSQVRECTGVLMQLAKGLGVTVFIVGHVTKEGVVAGPRMLEHMVDTVLYFEGDRHASYRILRGVKNRFGSTNEIGVFEMREEGLAEVPNPSEFMLEGRPAEASGAVTACSMEGTRPILLEVQALVSKTNFGLPRRTAAGVDYQPCEPAHGSVGKTMPLCPVRVRCVCQHCGRHEDERAGA